MCRYNPLHNVQRRRQTKAGLYTPILEGSADLEWVDEAWGHNYSQDCARGPKTHWARSTMSGLIPKKKEETTSVAGRQIDFTGTQADQGEKRPEVVTQIKATLVSALATNRNVNIEKHGLAPSDVIKNLEAPANNTSRLVLGALAAAAVAMFVQKFSSTNK